MHAGGKEGFGERRMEKEEKRHITQMREADARLTRGFLALASLVLSYFSRHRANAVSFRSAIALFRALILPLSLYSLFWEALSKYPTHAILASSLRSFPQKTERSDARESLHTANREAEKGHLRAAKLDRKGRHKLLGRYSPTSFSLACLSRCAASRPEICARRK